jgi:imidazolonepropionase-like amidohydrolase
VKRLLLIPLLVVFPGAVRGQANSGPARPVVAITQVTVIDATGAPARADQTVVSAEGRNIEVGKSRTVKAPEDAETVDGAGKFLIPGLWDMHAHIAAFDRAGAEALLASFLVNGVTGVREMHAYFADRMLALRPEIEAGKRSGPRIVAPGAMIDGPNPSAGGAIVAADAAEARAAVQSLKKRGADFIKVHSKLSRDAYFAVAREAKEQGVPFAGHVPECVNANDASDAGQRSIEHLSGL